MICEITDTFFNLTQEFINFPEMNKNVFVIEKITVNRDAITGNKLNHN